MNNYRTSNIYMILIYLSIDIIIEAANGGRRSSKMVPIVRLICTRLDVLDYGGTVQ